MVLKMKLRFFNKNLNHMVLGTIYGQLQKHLKLNHISWFS